MARRHWRRHSLSSAREGIESEGSRITPRLSAVKIVRFSSELAFARAIAAKAAAQPGIQQIAHRAGFRPTWRRTSSSACDRRLTTTAPRSLRRTAGLCAAHLSTTPNRLNRLLPRHAQQRLPVSFELGLMALVISLVLAFPVGIVSAMRPDTALDYVRNRFTVSRTLRSETRRRRPSAPPPAGSSAPVPPVW